MPLRLPVVRGMEPLLWVPGDMMSILVAGIVLIMWYAREEAAGKANQPIP